MNRFSNLIYRYKIITAKLAGGDYYWNVGRPNYAAVDQTPAPVNLSKKFFIEPAGPNYAQDKVINVEYFIITGDTDYFQAGDVISLSSGIDIPTVTVLQVPEEQEPLCMKTDKIGTISDTGTDICKNVYFDYLVAINTGGDQFPLLDPSFAEPRRRAVMYRRPGIVEGMTFQDLTLGEGSNSRWSIAMIDYRDKLMILHLEQPDRT